MVLSLPKSQGVRAGKDPKSIFFMALTAGQQHPLPEVTAGFRQNPQNSDLLAQLVLSFPSHASLSIFVAANETRPLICNDCEAPSSLTKLADDWAIPGHPDSGPQPLTFSQRVVLESQEAGWVKKHGQAGGSWQPGRRGASRVRLGVAPAERSEDMGPHPGPAPYSQETISLRWGDWWCSPSEPPCVFLENLRVTKG